MATTAAHISVLANQHVATFGKKGSMVVLRKQLVAGCILFIALVLQLWVRITIIERSYNLEKFREMALAGDTKLRELKLEYAYLVRPADLKDRVWAELEMKPTLPQQIRRIAVNKN